MAMLENRKAVRRPRGRPQIRPDEETRRLVIEAARHEFQTSGYARASMASVSQHAGVSTKTMYRLIPTKADLFRGESLFVGLNCFEPGQTQPVHTHAGADKFYLVVSGRARMTVGRDTREVGPGTVVWAPADVPHGVAEALERTVLLVGIAPPPR